MLIEREGGGLPHDRGGDVAAGQPQGLQHREIPLPARDPRRQRGDERAHREQGDHAREHRREVRDALGVVDHLRGKRRVVGRAEEVAAQALGRALDVDVAPELHEELVRGELRVAGKIEPVDGVLERDAAPAGLEGVVAAQVHEDPAHDAQARRRGRVGPGDDDGVAEVLVQCRQGAGSERDLGAPLAGGTKIAASCTFHERRKWGSACCDRRAPVKAARAMPPPTPTSTISAMVARQRRRCSDHARNQTALIRR